MARWRGFEVFFAGTAKNVYKQRSTGNVLADIEYEDGELEVICLSHVVQSMMKVGD